MQCDGELIVPLVYSGKSLSEGYLGQVDLWACLWGAVLILSVGVEDPV